MQVEYKQLEVWLHGKLKPLCVADPIPLSQYVIALIKKDKGEQELKEICMDQLEVFLQENTTKFVEDLFTALKSRAYISNEPSKPAQSSSSGLKEVSGKPHSGNHSFDNVPKDRKRNLSNSNPPSLTDSSSAKQKRKRSPEVKSKRISPGRSRSPHSSSRSINNTIIPGRQHGDSWNRGRHNDQMGESNLKTVDSHNRRNSSVNQQDSQMLMACCVDQSRDTGLLSQIANPPSILYNNNNNHNNNANNNNKGNWRNSRLPNHAQQQRYNNHRTSGNSVSRNIVTLPMVENVNSSETTLHQSVVNSAAAAAPPAYEPDRPHLSMISTSDSIVPAVYDDDANDVEHTTGSATAATPPLSYTPSPITEQISSYAVVPKTCEISNLSLDTVASRTVDPRTVLYVNRLPWRFNDENKIREHFAQFGNVINVVARYRGLADTAMVEFSSSDEAEKAYRSPVPMFSNRFIRIFTRLPENFQQNARNTNRRFPRPKSVLDRLGSRPMLDTNNKVNSYAWMNMNHDSVDNQQVAHETLPPNDTLHRGNRSRWRLERNPASGDALLSGDEEDDMADENPVTDFSGTSNFVKDVHKYQSRNMNIASSPYTLSLKQEADAISWERRKMAALKQRKEQLMILDKSREARESAIEVQRQRIVRIKLLLKRVMDQLENNRTNDIGSVTDSSKPLTLDERKKLLVEAKRLQSELECAIEAEKKVLANHTSLKETNSKKTKGSTTISAAALQALPAAVRMEREKQISEIQEEIDKAETALREMPQDSEKIKESRRRIVELKRQLVELETIRPSDILAPQTAAGFAAADGSVYPNRTQTKLDKRPRTLYITGIEADDVENFQNALSMNYLHTQSFTKLTDPGTDQLVLEVTFCTRDFAEAAIRQFSQFHGRDLHMSFVYPPMVPDSKSSSFSEDDVKHVSSTQAETSDQLQAITSSESLDYSSHSSPTSTTALNMISL
ncbi:unnamed protein product [Trichobilharzia szidati]|nr:unnamed protein product [Trichobilharzia szidati]